MPAVEPSANESPDPVGSTAADAGVFDGVGVFELDGVIGGVAVLVGVCVTVAGFEGVFVFDDDNDAPIDGDCVGDAVGDGVSGKHDVS